MLSSLTLETGQFLHEVPFFPLLHSVQCYTVAMALRAQPGIMLHHKDINTMLHRKDINNLLNVIFNYIFFSSVCNRCNRCTDPFRSNILKRFSGGVEFAHDHPLASLLTALLTVNAGGVTTSMALGKPLIAPFGNIPNLLTVVFFW